MNLKRLKTMNKWQLTKRGAYCESMSDKETPKRCNKKQELGYIRHLIRKKLND